MTTFNEVQHLLASRFGLDESEITPETALDRLGIDSLATLELGFELEDTFGIRLGDSAEPLKTVGDLVAAVESASRCARRPTPRPSPVEAHRV